MFKAVRQRLANWLLRDTGGEPATPPRLGIADPQPAVAPQQIEAMQPVAAQHRHTASYDLDLLQRAREQWMNADWNSLVELEPDTLQHHPDRAKLALLAAAAHTQLGNMQAAKQHARCALQWGCSKKLAAQVLIAGVHHSMGRAALLAGLEQRALPHFEYSLALGMPGIKGRLHCQNLAAKHMRQLFPPFTPPASGDFISGAAKPKFSFEAKSAFDLGLTWTSNSINTAIFWRYRTFTQDANQHSAFYVKEHALHLVQRDFENKAYKPTIFQLNTSSAMSTLALEEVEQQQSVAKP